MHLRAPNMAKKKYGRCLGDVCLMGGGRAELRAELAGESKRYRRVERGRVHVPVQNLGFEDNLDF